MSPEPSNEPHCKAVIETQH
jgi:glycosyltransferase involved in cell wall biosynthesis